MSKRNADSAGRDEAPIVLYTTPDGAVKVNVVFRDGNLWLPQAGIANGNSQTWEYQEARHRAGQCEQIAGRTNEQTHRYTQTLAARRFLTDGSEI
ncbi:MAG: hypothetical protein IJQ34_03230 [Kiritimatiellae bacterium]|nr:hypothetical protein [Kiritimatiellia bacterium]MBR0197124.1 hypothetical protein [Kiritimatiellia bacterium]